MFVPCLFAMPRAHAARNPREAVAARATLEAAGFEEASLAARLRGLARRYDPDLDGSMLPPVSEGDRALGQAVGHQLFNWPTVMPEGAEVQRHEWAIAWTEDPALGCPQAISLLASGTR